MTKQKRKTGLRDVIESCQNFSQQRLLTLRWRRWLNFCFDFYHPSQRLNTIMPLVNQPLCDKLKAARESRGLSLADVAHQTRIPVSRLVQLEEGNYAAFGSMAYARSFLRTYSKYLGVDSEEVIRSLPTPVLGGPADYKHLTESFGPWVSKRGSQGGPNHSQASKGASPAFAALTLTLLVAVGFIVYASVYVIPGLVRKGSAENAGHTVAAPTVVARPMEPGIKSPADMQIKKAEVPTMVVDAAAPNVPYRRATLVEEPSPRTASPQ